MTRDLEDLGGEDACGGADASPPENPTIRSVTDLGSSAQVVVVFVFVNDIDVDAAQTCSVDVLDADIVDAISVRFDLTAAFGPAGGSIAASFSIPFEFVPATTAVKSVSAMS